MKQRNPNTISTSTYRCLSIVDATERLLDGRSLDVISVNQICEAAAISRATFYYHFDDKFDVAQWHYDYVAENNLFETGRTLNWFQAVYRNTFEVIKHQNLYQGAFMSRGYQSLFAYSKRRRIESLEETITDYKHVGLDEELTFQIRALAESEVAMMSDWFKRGMPYELERLCRYLDNIVPRRLYLLLNDPVSPRLY